MEKRTDPEFRQTTFHRLVCITCIQNSKSLYARMYDSQYSVKKMDCILFIHFTDHNLMDMLVSIFGLF